MADAKWISGLQTDMPLEVAARLVLAARLEAVCAWLPKAVGEAAEDTENVHQLRVSTRRAGAALRIFKSCLPVKTWRRINKLLRELRRAAGAARDWDVFLDDLARRSKGATPRQKPGFDFLIGYGQGQRAAAQERLDEEASPEVEYALKNRIERTLVRVRAPAEPGAARTLEDHSGPLITELCEELNQAGGQDMGDYEHLHQVRILGKRLRYALEVFSCCFGPGFREGVYAAVVKMQEILGLANDSHVACQRLQAIGAWLSASGAKVWRRVQPGMEYLLNYHRRRLPRQRHKFEIWWRKWSAADGEQTLTDLFQSKTVYQLHAVS